MKTLGIGAGVLATTGAIAPIFNDLDELTASAPKNDRPWWVKTRDTNNPKNDIDWTILQKLDQRNYPMPATDQTDIITKAYEYIAEGCQKKTPGRSTRDLALTRGVAARDTLRYDLNYLWNGVPNMVTPLAGLPATNPWSSWWPPKWDGGSPEDNFQTIRAALHCFGADNVGALVLDEKSQKLLHWYTNYDNNEVNGRIEIDASAASNNRIYLPSSAKYVVVWTMHQNYLYNRHLISKGDMNGGLGYNNPLGFGTYRSYHDCIRTEYYLARFLQCMGWKVFTQMNQNVSTTIPYPTISPSANVNNPFGLFAGLGELSRASQVMTPTSGISQRQICLLITDFPIAPTKPIDFGGMEFCKSCKRCAEVCRGYAIPTDKEGTWDTNPAKGQRPGYFSWKLDWDACKKGGGNTDCGNCFIVCPFNHPNDGLIHPTVRIVSSATSIFAGFFAQVDRWMQYAKPMSEQQHYDWWYRDYKNYNGDTIIQAGKYNWNL